MIDPLMLTAQRLLVVAPHPDDEVLGCGGLIHAFSTNGRQVRIAFITDGGASHVASAAWSRPRLAAQRRHEALHAMDILGLVETDAVFLDLRDADMPAPDQAEWLEACERLEQLVRAFQPELTLLPWRRDPHRDHRDTWLIASAALTAARSDSETLEYAVWLEELGAPADYPDTDEAEAVVFDVTAGLKAKRSAVYAHRSQTTNFIHDDPTGFRLSSQTVDRLVGPSECYWRPLA